MQVSVSQVDALSREVTVEIPDADVERDVVQRLKVAATKVRIDGFRAGKAPLAEVRRRYGPSVRLEAIDAVVQKGMNEALSRDDVKMSSFITQPELLGGVKAGSPVVFRFYAESFPEFTPTGYQGVAVERPAVKVTADEIDREIAMLRRSRSVVEPVEDRTVSEAGDTVVLDVVALEEGPVEQLGGEGQEIDTSDPNLVPGLGVQLAGITIGETKNISLDLPVTFPVEEIAGQTVIVAATLTGLKRRVLPALDAELATDAGLGDSVEAMRAEIERRIVEARTTQIRKDSASKALAAVLAQNSFDLPTRYLDDLARREAMARLQEMARKNGIELPKDADAGELVPAVKPIVERAVRESILLDRIALTESIIVDETALTAHLETIAKSNNVPLARVRAAYSRDGAMDQVRNALRRDRVLDFILDRASFTEVEGSAVAGE